MANIKNIYKTLKDVDDEFMANVDKHAPNNCWEWKNKIFRFRHYDILFNPRHYALQMVGITIERGRNFIPGCGNPKCVNPDHTRMRDGTYPPRGIPLYLDLGMYSEKHGNITGHDFQFSDFYLGKKYHKEIEEIKAAREETFKLIENVKKSGHSLERLANMYKTSESFIKKIRDLTKDDFLAIEEANLQVEHLKAPAEKQPADAFRFVRTKR